MTTSKYIHPPELCTGCALCSNVCPKDTIKMVLNDEGFLVPNVNTTECINCGLCVKICPAFANTINREINEIPFDSVSAYGAWHKNVDILKKSSSGGIFSALAQHVFKKNGCVFGVIWKEKKSATFSKAENMQELSPMRGSKYTQAEPNYVYRDVKNELEKGRTVLFVGTACQVSALKKYLRIPYERLLLVDIICAGVPSRYLLFSYVDYLERVHRNKLHHINFRHKDGNWLNYKIQNNFTDGETFSEFSSMNPYMNLFLDGNLLNKCCYTCPYAHIPRQGDITLGDYWGIQNYNTNWPIANGVASIIVTTDKGKQTLETLKREGIIELHPQHFSALYSGQPHGYGARKGLQNSAYRKEVLEALRSQPLEVVHNTYYNLIRLCGIKVHRNCFFAKLSKMPKKLSTLIKTLLTKYK